MTAAAAASETSRQLKRSLTATPDYVVSDSESEGDDSLSSQPTRQRRRLSEDVAVAVPPSPSPSPSVDPSQLTGADLFRRPSPSAFTSRISSPPGCRIDYIPAFLTPLAIRLLLSLLSSITVWHTGQMHGHPIPRVSVWFGSESHRYAGKDWPSTPHPPLLLRFQSRLLDHFHAHIDAGCLPFTSVLVNKYRSGRDSVSRHSDHDGGAGPRQTVASISLGTTRTFFMARKEKPKGGGKRRSLRFELEEGSLLVMAGETQQHWVHGVPKQPEREGTRYNLTFRQWKPKADTASETATQLPETNGRTVGEAGGSSGSNGGTSRAEREVIELD